MEHTEPLQAAWALVNWLGPVIWWSKALAALVVGGTLQLMPQPTLRSTKTPNGLHRVEWFAVIWSRAGVFVGALLLMLSVLTPINAFGPLGDLVFFPAMAVNALCLLWCNRCVIISHLVNRRPPEVSLFRSFIAGRASRN